MAEGLDLLSGKAIDVVNRVLDDVLISNQRRLHDNGLALFLVKNRLLVNTALKLADRSVKFHDIPEEKISDIKKYAHVCFWMLRLQPISYTTDIAISDSLKSKLPKVALTMFPKISDSFILVDPAIRSHVPGNVEASFFTFLSLSSANRLEGEAFDRFYKKFVSSSYCFQIINSLRFHNYSSRSMAMFLESLFQNSVFDE
jgi:hypothetical protein